MFTIRVDKSIVDFYDDLARKTNRSRNELIGLALEMGRIHHKLLQNRTSPFRMSVQTDTGKKGILVYLVFTPGRYAAKALGTG